MKRYTSCLVFAAWLCASAKADDDQAYAPPVPLHEAVTASTRATDINDTTLTGAQEKPAAEVADSLRQGTAAPQETTDESTLTKSHAEGSTAPPSDTAKMSEITGSSDAPAETTSEAASSAAPVAAQIDETADEPKAPEMMQTTKRLFTDPISEMMGGEFNTETNQRMADSFLSVRSRVLHLKANRDF